MPIRIMLVDDDQDDQVFFSYALRNIAPDVELEIIEDADFALSKIKKQNNQPDLIFLDINLPKITGLELLKEFRKYVPATTRIIMLSTTTQLEIVRQAIEYGANDFYSKPSELDKLEAIIAMWLQPVTKE